VLGSFVSKLALRVVGSSALTAEDLGPALADMKVGLTDGLAVWLSGWLVAGRNE